MNMPRKTVLVAAVISGAFAVLVVAGGVTASLLVKRNAERQHAGMTPTAIPADEYRNSVWGRTYPRQYDSYMKTGTEEFSTKYAGSADRDLLAENPRLVLLWAGYYFSKDYHQARGHVHAVEDIRKIIRTGSPSTPGQGPMPSTCWSCKSTGVPRSMKNEGVEKFYTGKWARLGGEMGDPLGCSDCHESSTMSLTITRPALVEGLANLGKPAGRQSHQAMRTLVCAQCHVEYYFDKKESGAQYLTYPWHRGTTCDSIEAYYDSLGFCDWEHSISKVKMLKAQHPDFELFATGVHAKRGLSCAECHMPYETEGGSKFTSHHVRSPLDNVAKTCQVCHREETADLVADVYERQDRILQSKNNLEKQLVHAHFEAGKAWELGATNAQLTRALTGIRHAQWRWDYASASHGASFHSPVEVSRIIASGLDAVLEARLELARVLASLGFNSEVPVPDISTKEKAQAYLGIDLKKLNAEKKTFLDKVVPAWIASAREKKLVSE